MMQEDSASIFNFENLSEPQILFQRMIRSIEDYQKSFDFLDIESMLQQSMQVEKSDIESTVHIQFIDSSSSLQSPKKNRSKETKISLNSEIAIDNPSVKNSSDKKKRPDYKKNICGYITKTAVKQASSQDMKLTIKNICKKYNVNPEDFYRTYKTYQNITGPTHLYGLLMPRLQNLNIQQCIIEINIRIAFATYYRWFIRQRYLRYIMVEGKMERKDQYVQYKNRELLFIVTEEWRNLLIQMKKYLKANKNEKIDGKATEDYIQAKYDQLIEENSVKFDEKEFKDFLQQTQKQSDAINPEQIQQEKQQKVETKPQTQSYFNDSLFEELLNDECWVFN